VKPPPRQSDLETGQWLVAGVLQLIVRFDSNAWRRAATNCTWIALFIVYRAAAQHTTDPEGSAMGVMRAKTGMRLRVKTN